MKLSIKILLLSLCGLIFFGCASKRAMRSEANYSYGQAKPQKQSPPTASKSNFNNAEVVGYLDNQAFQYIRNSEASSENASIKKSENIDNELDKLKKELDNEGGKQSDKHDVASPASPQSKAKTKQKRMVAYDGTINSRSNKPDSLIAIAISMTESLKGYIESQNNNTVTLRIPAAHFGLVYDSLLKLGVVTDFQRSSEDITDAFRDTELRETVLEKTIERYTKLLRLVRHESEKIALLKEIERLSDELETLKVQKSVLALRASFAKIQYTVSYFTTEFTGISKLNTIKGFEWISYLNPLNPYRFGKRLDFIVPVGMVQITDRDYWISQSPTDSRIWTSQIENEPQGTSDFWIDAITSNLKEEFLKVDTNSVSGYRSVRCIPHEGANYRYTVSVKVNGNSVQIIQCYYPDEIQENRYSDSIKKALAAQGGAS